MEARRGERDNDALAEAGDAVLHPAAYTNGGFVVDMALVDTGRACDTLCSACGRATGPISIEAERVCSTAIVQATRFCRRQCAVSFYQRALEANDMDHMWSAVALRITAAFADAEHDSSNVRHMYARGADADAEITPLCVQHPELLSTVAPSMAAAAAAHGGEATATTQASWASVCRPRPSLAAASSTSLAGATPATPTSYMVFPTASMTYISTATTSPADCLSLPVQRPLSFPAHWYQPAFARPPSPLRHSLTAAELAAASTTQSAGSLSSTMLDLPSASAMDV